MANAIEEDVLRDVHKLVNYLKEHGTKDSQGKFTLTFGKLYDDTQDIFEALNGTLKAAKKRGFINFEGQMLLKGPSDKVVITLLKEE